jgi:hypothetical protein
LPLCIATGERVTSDRVPDTYEHDLALKNNHPDRKY